MYCMKCDCFGNIVILAWGTQMKQVSCHQAPLCQGDTLKIGRAGLDVILFLSSPRLFVCLFVCLGLHSSWLYQAGLIMLTQMLQNGSQLACDGFVLCVQSEWRISYGVCHFVSHHRRVLCCSPSWGVLCKADCGYALISWQVRFMLQLLLRRQEMSWFGLCFFPCVPGNHFLPWICDGIVQSFVRCCFAGDFLISVRV